jgi:hypothetical protein
MTVTYWEVGNHDGASIVVAVDARFVYDSFVAVLGLFEIRAGEPHFITCPSARTTDPCVDVTDGLRAGVTVDGDIFYDSLTYPASFEVFPGYVFTTAATLHDFDGGETILGDGEFVLPAPGDGEVIDPRAYATLTVLASFGDTEIVEVAWPTDSAGLTNVLYALRMPTGAIRAFSGSDVPAGAFNAIEWNDGVERTATHQWRGDDFVLSPTAGVCFPGHVTREASHVDTDWVAAGMAPGGVIVYLPVGGGNPVASQIRAQMDLWSYGWDWETDSEIPYPFADDASFLAADALFAVHRPDGAWVLGLRPDATNLAYECV